MARKAGAPALGIAVGLLERGLVGVGQVLRMGDLDVRAVGHGECARMAYPKPADEVDAFIGGKEAAGAEGRVEAVDGEKELARQNDGVLGDGVAESGVVDGDFVVVAEDAGGAALGLDGLQDEEAGVALVDAFAEVGQGGGQELAVVVGKADPDAVGAMRAQVAGGGGVGFLLAQVDDLEERLKVVDGGDEAVVRVLVDDEDLKRSIGVEGEALQAGPEFVASAQGGDDEREPGPVGIRCVRSHGCSQAFVAGR